MNRYHILQALIDKTGAKTYLEIGVHNGSIIGRLNGPKKIGVDPSPKLGLKGTIRKLNPASSFSLHKVTSDEFFERSAKSTLRSGVDVVFVDGLHTYDQAFRDVENCLPFLNEGGYIVMHDCNPLNSAGAYPVKNSINEVLKVAAKGELPGWTGHWNGDVWRALVHLRLKHTDLYIQTIDLDWGLGVITKGDSVSINHLLKVEELANKDFSFLQKHREELINLKTPKQFLESIA